MTIEWTEWNEDTIREVHGNIHFYRDLYEGNHAQHFPRAQQLMEQGEIIDNITKGARYARNIQTPYLMANVSKIIPEIPATMISRSLGPAVSPSGDEIERQKDIIEGIENDSGLTFEHWTNIVQQQVDGGLVGVVWNDERGLRIDFKQRDVYFPHEDGRGCDLAYQRKMEGDDYLHVYRERVEADGLTCSHTLHRIKEGGKLETVTEDDTRRLLQLTENPTFYPDRNRPFVVYWANERTFQNPLGVSVLKNQEGRQEEINWTLTRNAMTFERNGKPRIAISKEIFQALQDKAFERYGDESLIDHRDLEITTFDESGKAMEVIQVDISQIGNMEWVKDLMKLMFVETRTSEKAVDFYLDDGAGTAQSGVAKFYDLFTSITKAEHLRDEYIHFLQQLFENALYHANRLDDTVAIERPDFTVGSMVPISRKELLDENVAAYVNGIISLETAVRRLNPQASDEWIEGELARIEEEGAMDDTTTLSRTRQTLQNYLDNRNQNGEPIQDDE